MGGHKSQPQPAYREKTLSSSWSIANKLLDFTAAAPNYILTPDLA